ncbi:hypothetical protein M3Y95_01269000 [Aphelenchoides besseyi]|nr:hypothetical protein M3Y95_01269000 [Aphelenchoides besseyi]
MRHQLLSNFIFYLFCWIVTSFSGIVQAFYMAIDGYFADEFYGPFVFWFGLCFRASSTATSFAVAFLLLDRIAILTWPISFVRLQRCFITLSMIVSMASGLFLIVAIPLVEPRLSKTTSCSIFVCLLKVFPSTVLPAMKTWPGIFTVIFTFIFAFKLIRYEREDVRIQQSLRQAHIITMIPCCSELFLNLLPYFLWTIILYIKGNHLNDMGPITSLFLATDSIVSAVCYRITLNKKQSSKISSIGTRLQ